MSDNENIDNTPDEDVEGHRLGGPIRNKAEEGDDVEGHRFKMADGGDDDVEGHRFKKVDGGDDDVEGHRYKK